MIPFPWFLDFYVKKTLVYQRIEYSFELQIISYNSNLYMNLHPDIENAL